MSTVTNYHAVPVTVTITVRLPFVSDSQTVVQEYVLDLLPGETFEYQVTPEATGKIKLEDLHKYELQNGTVVHVCKILEAFSALAPFNYHGGSWDVTGKCTKPPYALRPSFEGLNVIKDLGLHDTPTEGTQ